MKALGYIAAAAAGFVTAVWLTDAYDNELIRQYQELADELDEECQNLALECKKLCQQRGIRCPGDCFSCDYSDPYKIREYVRNKHVNG